MDNKENTQKIDGLLDENELLRNTIKNLLMLCTRAGRKYGDNNLSEHAIRIAGNAGVSLSILRD